MLYYPQAALWVVGLAPLCQSLQTVAQGGFLLPLWLLSHAMFSL
nr:MAG TPA: hypothetical protein [Caudoviricetes sp.]